MEMNLPLESHLRQGLREVTAPPELWDRVQSGEAPKPLAASRSFVWTLALAVALAAVALSLVRSPARSDSQQIAFRCQNPAQLRAWVQANTGFNVPLRASLPPSIQLIGARRVANSAEIAYRAGNRDAVLLVSRADGSANISNIPHNRATGNVSSWIMAGQRFTLACADPAALQLACKLCHLD